MKKLIAYFADKHLFANFTFLAILLGGVIFWQTTSKEELPDMSFDTLTISTVYPGASAREVENAVTWPIEDELRTLDGIEKIQSTSSEGISTIRLEMEKDLPNRASFISEVRSVILSVDLPSEILDPPGIREFKTSTKAVIDIGVYLKGTEFLTDEDRRILQRHVHTLEQRLLALPEVSRISKSGYLKEEFQIQIKPQKLMEYRIPIATLLAEIRNASVRQPAGALESSDEARVTVDAELDKISEFEHLPIQGNFTGGLVPLSNISDIKDTFEENRGVIKINGREGVILNVSKRSSSGILVAVDSIKEEVTRFQTELGPTSPVGIAILDDESTDVRNRIWLIGSNGIIGFILILSFLFIFLNFRSGFWVAMGIPFTLGSTMIIASLMGFTINSITLAAVIIVMGMVVDDAIVVAENIMRLRSRGHSVFEAAVEGTAYVLLPITASILTTIAAFLPLLLFEGRLSLMTDSIPPIISLMLLSSLFESVFLLPAHMNLNIDRRWRMLFTLGTLPYVERFISRRRMEKTTRHIADQNISDHWFFYVERWYSRSLADVLRYRVWIVIFFIGFVALGIVLMIHSMKFSLFPREEATQIRITAEAPEGTRRYETARRASQIEKIFDKHMGNEVVGYRTLVRQSHHGAVASENTVSIRLELVPRDQRERSLNSLIEEWEKKFESIEGFEKIHISRSHFGSASGSPIEVVLQQNNSEKRSAAADMLVKKMIELPEISGSEVGESLRSPEYSIDPDRLLIRRLEISTSNISKALRTALEGTVLYELNIGDEMKNVRVTVPRNLKGRIEDALNVPVGNNSGYLVPLRNVVKIVKSDNPSEIQRLDLQRMVMVYGDIEPGSGATPLDIAHTLETRIFPQISRTFPGTIFSFEGEIKLSRESSIFFPFAIGLSLFSIYLILALQFDSVHRPLTVLLAIPPAMASVIYTFILHGMENYGFFGVIGAIGLSGVIVNDAIVLLKMLDDEYPGFTDRESSNKEISRITSTRLRAVLLTTLTTVAGLFPTAYGVTGYDSMLAEMMLAISWGLVFGTMITLVLIPSVYSLEKEFVHRMNSMVKEGDLR